MYGSNFYVSDVMLIYFGRSRLFIKDALKRLKSFKLKMKTSQISIELIEPGTTKGQLTLA